MLTASLYPCAALAAVSAVQTAAPPSARAAAMSSSPAVHVHDHCTVTQHMAEEAHTTIVNALTTPTVESLHDRAPSAVSIVVSDPASFAAKRAAMVAAGPSKLQVIADFDRTVSAFRTSNGAMCAASHQLLESCVGFDNASFQPKMDAINTKVRCGTSNGAHLQLWLQLGGGCLSGGG